MGTVVRCSVSAVLLGVAIGAAALAFASVVPTRLAAADLGFLQNLALQEQTPEQEVRGFVRQTYRDLRRWLRRSSRLLGRSAGMWGKWLKRAVFSFMTIAIFLMADRSLISAWRRQGLSVLAKNAPLILIVYLRLLLTPRVAALAKVFMLLAIVYGIKRSELIPDRGFLSGKLDDFVLLGLATRAFVRSCPSALVERHAAEAIGWRRQVARLRRRPAS
jgi:uncharacterized membrane protein YkvA (DUF1232 family)